MCSAVRGVAAACVASRSSKRRRPSDKSSPSRSPAGPVRRPPHRAPPLLARRAGHQRPTSTNPPLSDGLVAVDVPEVCPIQGPGVLDGLTRLRLVPYRRVRKRQSGTANPRRVRVARGRAARVRLGSVSGARVLRRSVTLTAGRSYSFLSSSSEPLKCVVYRKPVICVVCAICVICGPRRTSCT